VRMPLSQFALCVVICARPPRARKRANGIRLWPSARRAQCSSHESVRDRPPAIG
jgi:hypothetical protein